MSLNSSFLSITISPFNDAPLKRKRKRYIYRKLKRFTQIAHSFKYGPITSKLPLGQMLSNSPNLNALTQIKVIDFGANITFDNYCYSSSVIHRSTC